MRIIKPYNIFEELRKPVIYFGKIQQKIRMFEDFLGECTINPDGTVDVVGDVDLSARCGGRYGIILKFGKVSGNFNCSGNRVFDLRGCPSYVGGNFDCAGNILESLEGAPMEVGGDFNCSGNELSSLQGCPIEVGGNFDCSINLRLTQLDTVASIGGDIICARTNINPKKNGFNGWCGGEIKYIK